MKGIESELVEVKWYYIENWLSDWFSKWPVSSIDLQSGKIYRSLSYSFMSEHDEEDKNSIYKIFFQLVTTWVWDILWVWVWDKIKLDDPSFCKNGLTDIVWFDTYPDDQEIFLECRHCLSMCASVRLYHKMRMRLLYCTFDEFTFNPLLAH